MSEGLSPTIDYLVRTLQLNPVIQGDEIIRARATALGLKQDLVVAKVVAGNSGSGQERRDRIARLEEAREAFWTISTDELTAKLAALDKGEFPDIQLAVQRLRVIASHRDAVLELLQGTDQSFRHRLEHVLTGNRADATAAKQDLIADSAVRKLRKQRRRVLKRMKMEIPVIYEMESEWLNMLYAYRQTSLMQTNIPGLRLPRFLAKRIRLVTGISLVLLAAAAPTTIPLIGLWLSYLLVQSFWRKAVMKKK